MTLMAPLRGKFDIYKDGGKGDLPVGGNFPMDVITTGDNRK
jgi:hypothetical protein